MVSTSDYQFLGYLVVAESAVDDVPGAISPKGDGTATLHTDVFIDQVFGPIVGRSVVGIRAQGEMRVHLLDRPPDSIEFVLNAMLVSDEVRSQATTGDPNSIVGGYYALPWPEGPLSGVSAFVVVPGKLPGLTRGWNRWHLEPRLFKGDRLVVS